MTVDSPQTPDPVVCLLTTPQGNARAIAAAVVDKQLAACVNIVALVQSVYRWRGQVEHDEESLLILKTTRAAIAPLEQLLREIHPYETFELIAIDIAAGSHPYLQWIQDSVAPAR